MDKRELCNLHTEGRHNFIPAYWRTSKPTYKRCSTCGLIEKGSEEEIKRWAEESPWKDDKKALL